MLDEPWFDVERRALDRLQRSAKDRAERELAIAEAYRSETEAAEREVAKARKQLATQLRKSEDELARDRAKFEADLAERLQTELGQAEREHADSKKSSEVKYQKAEAAMKLEYQDRLWTIDSLHEAGEKEANDRKAEADRTTSASAARIRELWDGCEKSLGAVNVPREKIEFDIARLPELQTSDIEGKLEKDLENCESALDRIGHATLPKLTGVVGTMCCVFAAGGIATAVAIAMKLELIPIIVVAVSGALLGGLLLRQLLYWLAKRQVRDRATAFGVFIAESERSLERFKKVSEARQKSTLSKLKALQTEDRQSTDTLYRPKIQGIVKQSVTVQAKLDRDLAETRRTLLAERDAEMKEMTEELDGRASEFRKRFEDETKSSESRFTEKGTASTATRDRDFQKLSSDWFEALKQTQNDFEALQQSSVSAFPNWSAFLAEPNRVVSAIPSGIRFGDYAVDQTALPHGISDDERLRTAEPIRAILPALLPFPDRSAVAFKARDAGRPATIAALQAIMLRYLTGLPPGKVRFTIFDPVGLGDSFAEFMHLADSDPLLVSDRIWTEPGQIEEKLADLSLHTENVIQKYLRKQYKNIEEYNRAAGEVAEPYRVLVIANFPVNFTPDAAKRLISLMASGPTCGVCTLVGIDTAVTPPRDFRMADLDQLAAVFTWKEGKFTPKDPALAPFPLTVDSPPSSGEIAEIARRVGVSSRLAARVEVPFEFISPKPSGVWQASTKSGFDVAIGRAGATRQQKFSLGRGTAQHALIAGKTGSGKSTLLHALITNIALNYSPEEAELYLIDFKEGVEFKMYATVQLPHARVVAIESEREFGLSVLQRLDGILKQRGELYRQAAVNDFAGYREARPDQMLPRILLVVDEFHLFFVEDDKLAQEAALYLDRLVRQGRAFGVHVLLGSQTLGGTSSLPRSTLDQMAVRIALQCSEADAQLILSKDNTAARLLTRPGEAIYNDANGLPEGNDPFQVVWLGEDQREKLLAPLRTRTGKHYPPPLVFEGSRAADLSENPELASIQTRGTRSALRIWLGEAVAIKPPTACEFPAQSGSNLLLVGQANESALGIFGAAIVALAVEGRASVKVLDGTPEESEHADVLRDICRGLGQGDAIVERYRLGEGLAEIAAEVDRRMKGSPDRKPQFLLVNGLHRFRELRKADDDFGFNRKAEKTISPAEAFATILREGPAYGIHSIVWCDSATNLSRAFERGTLKEFTQKVLFPMNPNDSSQLMDTPAASKLGVNRALFLEDGQERPEKFRPYGILRSDDLRALLKDLNFTVPESADDVPTRAESIPNEALSAVE